MRSIQFIVFLIISGTLFAGEVTSSASPSVRTAVTPAFKEPFSGEALTQLVVGLLVVVALIFLLSWVVKRFSGMSPVTKYMRVVGVLPLSTREKAVLVKVGKRHLLLGVAPGRVSHLHSFEAGDIEEPSDSEADSFSVRLADVIKQRIKTEQQEGKVNE